METETPKLKCVVIGDDDKSVREITEVLKATEVRVLRTGCWGQQSNGIVFVRLSDGGSWSLRRFCDGADATAVAVGPAQEAAETNTQDDAFDGPFYRRTTKPIDDACIPDARSPAGNGRDDMVN